MGATFANRIPTNVQKNFTYLTTLPEYIEKNGIVSSLPGEVISRLNALNNNLNPSGKRISNALNFLRRIAANEIKKEGELIDTYLTSLDNIFNETQVTDIQKIIEQLQQELLQAKRSSVFNVERINKDYGILIEIINFTIGEAEKYKKELALLKSSNKPTAQALETQDYRFRLATDFNYMANSLAGRMLDIANKREARFLKNLQGIIFDLLKKKPILQAHLASGVNPVTLVAGILGDLSPYIQQAADKYIQQQTGDLFSITKKEFAKIYSAYAKNLGKDPQTNFTKALNLDAKDARFKNLVSNINSTLGIKFHPRYPYTNAQNLGNLNQDTLGAQLLSANIITPNMFKKAEQTTISITAEYKNAHGAINEWLQSQLSKYITNNVGPQVATDWLTFTIKVDANQKLSNIVQTANDEIIQAFKPYAHRQTYATPSSMKILMGMQKNILAAETKLDAALQELMQTKTQLKTRDFSHLFVIHMTGKLYKQIETSTGNFSYFEGRKLKILSYIEELYAMNRLNGLVLPSRTLMELFAHNMASFTLGGSIGKDRLQDYLTIFSGLIMTDDLAQIAMEAAGAITYDTITNIHLYNINGLYFPTSYILMHIISVMEQIQQNLTAEDGFGMEAFIQLPVADTSKGAGTGSPFYVKPNGKMSSYQRWNKTGRNVVDNTTVIIKFLSSFSDLIEQLFDIS